MSPPKNRWEQSFVAIPIDLEILHCMVGVESRPIVWSSTDGKWTGAYMSFSGKQEGNDIVELRRS